MRDATARALVGAVLGRTRGGEIEVVENGRSRVFGEPTDLRATVRIKDPAAWRGPLNGSIGLGESYVDGLWETDDLVALIQIVARSLSRQHRGVSAAVARSRAAFHRLRGLVPENTRGGARANISAHYDLGNDLFASFLDPTMMYSCAYFPREDATLEEAQLAKLDRICERLQLGPDTHLLEIGTGWGGMAMHAARTTGCRVTTTTISRAQHELATERVREAGLEDRITILLEDYRDLERHLRPAGLDRDDRGGRLAVLRHLLQDLRPAARRRRPLPAAGDHRRRPPLRGGEGVEELRQHARLPRRLPALAEADRRQRRLVTEMREIWLDDITAHYPPTLASGASASSPPGTASRRTATTSASSGSGTSTCRLRGGLPRAPHRRRPGALREAVVPMSAAGEPGSGRRRAGRRARAAAPDPRARRRLARLGPGRAAAVPAPRGHRARHAGLRHRPAAAAGGRADRRGARRRAPRAARRPRHRAPPRRRQQPRRLGRAGTGTDGRGALGHLPLPRRALARADRPAQGLAPASGRGACARWSRRRSGSARSADRAVSTFAAHPGNIPDRAPPANSSSAGSTPKATTAPTRRCASTSSTRPAIPPTCR